MKIRFVCQSRSFLACELGGYEALLWAFFNRCKVQGIRGAAGWLLSRAAHARRNDNGLYLNWVAKEMIHAPVPSKYSFFAVVLSAECFSAHRDQGLKFLMEQQFQNVIVFGRLDAELPESESVPVQTAANLTELRHLLDRNDFPENVILFSSPAQLNWRLSGMLEQALYHSDVVFWDHDYIDEGTRCSPVFKGAFSTETLLDPESIPAWATRKSVLLAQITEPLEATVYGLSLDMFSKSRTISKLDAVMTHHLCETQSWREKDAIFARHFEFEVDLSLKDYLVPDLFNKISPSTRVSIVIPTRNRLDLILNCLDSIQKFEYEYDFEFIIVNNGSDDSDFLDWLGRTSESGEIVRIDSPGKFNWSLLNNEAAKVAHGDVLIFMNNDVEVTSADWLFKLCSLALDPDVGAVGPLLVYPDGLIQHAGVVLGFGGMADHIYMGSPVPLLDEKLIFKHPLHRRQVSAVTGACLAISKEKFSKLNGFDESLSIAGDIELCLRLASLGLRNLYLPSVKMVHLESATRSKGLPLEDIGRLKKLLPSTDPHYNSNLSLNSLTPMPNL